jgi:hypothetical protein
MTFNILCLFYYYICNMNKKDFKIVQKHISLCHDDYEDSRNYLILIETINDVPQLTYMVDMHGFMYYDMTMPPFYVNNKN